MEIDLTAALTTVQEMVQGLIAALPRIAVGLLIFVVFYVVAKGGHRFVSGVARRTRGSEQAALALGRLAQWTTVLVGLLVALVVVFPSFQVAELVGILGISSVAIGFAFRDIAQNFLAGILILLTEPFRLGDQIVVNQFEGTVVNIETRATTIRTYDNRLVVIPNSTLFGDSVVVNTAFHQRRLEHDVGISYSDDIGKASRLILSVLSGIQGVLAEPAPEVVVVDLADFSVRLRVRWWIEPAVRAEAIDTRDKVLRAIGQALPAHGITMPFPTQQVLLGNGRLEKPPAGAN